MITIWGNLVTTRRKTLKRCSCLATTSVNATQHLQMSERLSSAAHSLLHHSSFKFPLFCTRSSPSVAAVCEVSGTAGGGSFTAMDERRQREAPWVLHVTVGTGMKWCPYQRKHQQTLWQTLQMRGFGKHYIRTNVASFAPVRSPRRIFRLLKVNVES